MFICVHIVSYVQYMSYIHFKNMFTRILENYYVEDLLKLNRPYMDSLHYYYCHYYCYCA